MDVSRETILFDPHARSIVTDLVRGRPADDPDVARLARHLGIL